MNSFSNHAPALQKVQIRGGKLVKPFDENSKDQYLQCVADVGADSVQIALFAATDVALFLDDVKIQSGEWIRIGLRAEGYGYVTKTVRLVHEAATSAKTVILAVLKPAPDQKVLYGLENRPQFHYTAPYGYINDPNGMIYDATSGNYHLFYQAYPYAAKAAHKHWGHAVTKDLVTFKEYPTALYPDDHGSMWSGTAIIDYDNTARLYDESTPPAARMLLVYYAWQESQTGAGLAYTPDGGETWIKAHDGQLFHFIGAKPCHVDPKVLWHERLKKWIMFCASGNVYTSTDLWNWTYNIFNKSWECPDIYEIKVQETGETKYVRTYGGSLYCVGDIVEENGVVKFVAESEEIVYNGDSLDRSKSEEILKQYGWYSGKSGTFYAAQHYAEAPNGRIVSVGWMIERGADLTGTWAGAMSIATEQTLHRKSDGSYLLCHYPVAELKALRGAPLFTVSNAKVTPTSENILSGVSARYADINAQLLLDGNVTEIGFRLRTGHDSGDITVKYDVAQRLLVADYSRSKHAAYNGIRTMKMEKPHDGRVSLRILLDSIIVESFGNGGEACVSSVFGRDNECQGMEFFVVGGNATVEAMEIYPMRSAWDQE